MPQGPVLQGIDDGRTHDQSEAGADRKEGRDAQRQQAAGDQEPAPHTKETAESACDEAQQQKEVRIDHYLGDGEKHCYLEERLPSFRAARAVERSRNTVSQNPNSARPAAATTPVTSNAHSNGRPSFMLFRNSATESYMAMALIAWHQEQSTALSDGTGRRLDAQVFPAGGQRRPSSVLGGPVARVNTLLSLRFAEAGKYHGRGNDRRY